jgi:hypothetical protein
MTDSVDTRSWMKSGPTTAIFKYVPPAFISRLLKKLSPVADVLLSRVVAGFSPRSTRFKLTRAKARDYMLTAAFRPNEGFFSILLGGWNLQLLTSIFCRFARTQIETAIIN